MPVSRTAMLIRWESAPTGAASSSTTTSPRSVNLTALDSRLSSTWRSRAASPSTPAGTPSPTRQPSSIPFSEALRATMSSEPSTQSRRSKGARSSSSLPTSILEIVEDVVDHVQQRIAAGADDLGELALLGRELGVEQQVAHADHGVHRRPDLVAHGGQESGLGLCRRLGVLTSTLELAQVARLVDRGRGERCEGIGRPGQLGAVGVWFERVEGEHPDQAITDQQGHCHPGPDHAVDVGILEPRVVLGGSEMIIVSCRWTSSQAGSSGPRHA